MHLYAWIEMHTERSSIRLELSYKPNHNHVTIAIAVAFNT